MKIKYILTAALVSAGFGAVALADEDGGKKPKGKGPGGPEALVKRLDADKDGELSVSELSKMKEEQRTRLLKRVDTNADGALDKDEIAKWKEKAAKGGDRKKKGGGEEKEKKDGE